MKSITSGSIARYGIMLLCCLLFGSYVLAQGITVKGKVTTNEGTAVGVNIREKGTNKGATTNANGEYTINVSKTGATLIFSYIGYTTQEVTVAGGEQNITLQADNKNLQELVVTALGIKKEAKRIGYSTAQVKGDDLVKARDPNALNSLVGKVSGLTVGASAEMLGRPQIVLRGSTDLLMVVDGVPVNTDTWNINADDIESYTILKGPNAAALYGFRGQNGAIIINTKHGSKDKRGFAVDFNSSTMLEKGWTAVPKAQTEYGYGTAYTYDYGSGLYSTASTAGNGSYRANIWGPLFDGQMVRQYDSPIDPTTGIRGKSPWIARGKDNFEKFMEPGLLSTNSVAVSSSGDNYDMRMSYAHIYQKGTAPNTRLNMDNLALNTSYAISRKLRADASMNLSIQYTPNIPDVAYGPNSYPYMFKVYGSANWSIDDMKDYYKSPANNPLGKQDLQQYYAEYGRENNPYFVAAKWLHGHNKTDINGFVRLTYTFNDHVNLAVRSQVTTWDQTRTEKVPASLVLNTYLAPAGSPLTSWAGSPDPGSPVAYTGDYRVDHRKLLENNTDLLLNYNGNLGKSFSLSASAGASERSFQYNSDWSTTAWLQTPGVYTLTNTKSATKPYSWGSVMQVYSAYYTVDLGYKNYINVSTTGRLDALSTLPKGNRNFFYPSVSVSSVISDYVKMDGALSFLKVRASWADVRGALTRSTAPSAYMLTSGKTVNAGLLGYGSELYTPYDGPTYQNQTAYNSTTYYNNTPSVSYSSSVSNPDLKAFKVGSYEAGVDAKFLKNRLSLDATYFTTHNGPQIIQFPLPSSTGYTSVLENAIATQKKGWEIAVSGAPIRNPKGFGWDVTLNYATYKETLDQIGLGQNQFPVTTTHNFKKGERVDGYYGYKYVRDQSGNIVHSGGIVLAPKTGIDNMQYLGNLNPDFVFGINNRFSYKTFSLSFQVDGRVGGVIYDEVWSRQMNSGTAIETVQGDYGVARLADGKVASGNGGALPSGYAGSYVGKGVKITAGTPIYDHGKITNYKDLTFAPNDVKTTVQNYVSNGIYAANIDEAFLISRTYVKLREVTLNYNVPAHILAGSPFRNASVSLVGRNLLYFAARKDMDLDQYASGFNFGDRSVSGVRAVNSDLQSATARRYGININLGF